MRSIGDYDCIWEYTIIARTDKTVTLNNGSKFRIFIHDGIEKIRPLGKYSMCPILSANHIVADKIL